MSDDDKKPVDKTKDTIEVISILLLFIMAVVFVFWDDARNRVLQGWANLLGGQF